MLRVKLRLRSSVSDSQTRPAGAVKETFCEWKKYC
jgi:hypothetical protein